MFLTSALDLWKYRVKFNNIITFCQDLDEALGNGIEIDGSVTELCGAPGTGKTQLCLQLCVNSQIPKQLGGVGGESIYIDTNRGFTPQRIRELASYFIIRCKAAAQQHNIEIENITEEHILERFHCTFVNDYIELLAAIESLKDYFENNTNIHLIVIDSFSYLFQNSLIDLTKRIRIMCTCITDLQRLAQKYNCAIVITNELTTKIVENDTQILPALGDSHTHKINNRILLGIKGSFHYATIDKHTSQPKRAVKFQITRNGIRCKTEITK